METRFDRHLPLFGAEGQELLKSTSVAVIGLGGTGSHLAQQLAFLGVGKLYLVDRDKIDQTSRNRLIGSRESDLTESRNKVEIAEEMIADINGGIVVHKIDQSFISDAGYQAVLSSDYVFGCVDRDSVRLVLNELCQAFRKPYFDIATDVEENNPRNFGGRLVYSVDGEGCVYCRGELDDEWISADFSTDAQRKEEEAIYGIRRSLLRRGGPSVVSLNGILSSVAVTEFMVERVGLRRAAKHLVYRGAWGVLMKGKDETPPSCYYCRGLYGSEESAGTRRYIEEGWGKTL